MALSVTYTMFNGQLVYENRAGTQSFYAPDTLARIIHARFKRATPCVFNV